MNALHREREKKAEWKALLNKGGWGWPCQKSEGSWQSGECLWPGLLSFALQLRLRSVLSHNTICILDYFVCASWPGIPSQELLLLLPLLFPVGDSNPPQGDPELGGFAISSYWISTNNTKICEQNQKYSYFYDFCNLPRPLIYFFTFLPSGRWSF